MAESLKQQDDPAALTEMHQDFVDSHWDSLSVTQLADLYRQREQEQKGLPDDEKLGFHAWFDQRIREANMRWLKTDASIRKHDGSPIEYQAAIVRQNLWNNWLLFNHGDRDLGNYKQFVQRGLAWQSQSNKNGTSVGVDGSLKDDLASTQRSRTFEVSGFATGDEAANDPALRYVRPRYPDGPPTTLTDALLISSSIFNIPNYLNFTTIESISGGARAKYLWVNNVRNNDLVRKSDIFRNGTVPVLISKSVLQNRYLAIATIGHEVYEIRELIRRFDL